MKFLPEMTGTTKVVQMGCPGLSQAFHLYILTLGQGIRPDLDLSL